MEAVGPFARLQRWLVLGDSSARAPHIVLLDAGLAAHFEPMVYEHVHGFFTAMVSGEPPLAPRALRGAPLS